MRTQISKYNTEIVNCLKEIRAWLKIFCTQARVKYEHGKKGKILIRLRATAVMYIEYTEMKKTLYRDVAFHALNFFVVDKIPCKYV